MTDQRERMVDALMDADTRWSDLGVSRKDFYVWADALIARNIRVVDVDEIKRLYDAIVLVATEVDAADNNTSVTNSRVSLVLALAKDILSDYL